MDHLHVDSYERSLQLNSDLVPGGVIVCHTDGDEEIVHVNRFMLELMECETDGEFLAHTGGTLKGFIYEKDATVEEGIRNQIGQDGDQCRVFFRIMTKSGKLVNVEYVGRFMAEPGQRPMLYGIVFEVTQRGSVDWLTGLPSMARFHRIARVAAKNAIDDGQRPAAIAFDLIGMKSYNAQNGRKAGDALLRAFADALTKQFGSEACSRFAEDHFYAFATAEDAIAQVEAVFDAFKTVGGKKALPVRAGIYLCEPGDDIAAVGFDRAKAACDSDRKTWSSHLVLYNDEMRAKEDLRIHVVNHLDQSIKEGWIRPYYQAIVRAATGDACGEEALARWVDPVYGQLSPDQFIPVLEEAGLLQKLDMHIIDCVLHDLIARRDHGISLVPVSVNVSLTDLDKIDFATEVARKADALGVPHSLLRIEFTESAASNNPDLFREQIRSLREAGFDVWMDDFGSGNSSLNLLKDFKFDLIKLDMGFISDIDDEAARNIVAGVVEVARNLGVDTLAEGIETKDQALFLEHVGCDMLQGYYFTRPQPLEIILGRYMRDGGMRREDLNELPYWSAIGGFSLSDPSANIEGYGVDGTPISEFPAGVMECRDGVWYFTRANRSFREFLDRTGLLSAERSDLESNPVENDLGEDFFRAVKRCTESGSWERIAGRLEYGTGFQFYIRPLCGTEHSDAFAVASVPTMLGTALGSYGDVPVAYAVFRVKLNDAGNEAVDIEYVYANQMYCDWGNLDPMDLLGRSFLEVVENASPEWFPYCYRAAVLGETIHDVVYSKESGHWLSFSIAPSLIEGCCVYAFMMADEERRERSEILAERDTSDFVIKIANTLNSESDYDTAMNATLQMMSEVIHPERLYIFERGELTTDNTFEWCAEGVEPEIDTLQNLDNSEFDTWERLLAEDSIVIIPDATAFKDIDERMYWQLERQGITHLLAVPFISHGKLIGFLGADNYALEERIDTKRVLETVAAFMCSRIANHRLLHELEWAGTHDALTGLFNRRGIDLAISAHMAEHADEPFTLALMDIDNFKAINDRHGHSIGDAALKILGKAVSDTFADNIVVGRNGGDEFLVILPGLDREHADALFGDFAKSNLVVYEGDEGAYRLTLSIGYSSYPDQAQSLKEAYTQADSAMYSVKLAGKAGARRYSPELESQYRAQLGFTPRDIADNLPGAVMIHRAGGEGDILFANNELVSMFECESLSEFMEHTGGTFRGIVHPEDQERVYGELVGQVGLDDIGEKNFSDFRVLTKTGNIKRIADNGRLVEIEDIGKVFYVLMVDQDERSEG